ncbi:hypothetical protein O3M35_006628 [Rhynocoris fuscipes]|uniref:Uncharacterized protein n=1 Tax=Rhynocoris fuscipes TaxID=488301 RepID=A0AAW1DGR1_9HEMI
MPESYKFFDLCGKRGAPNIRIQEELKKCGVAITKSELRTNLANAVLLGYMIKKPTGHTFAERICDRHVIRLLTNPSLYSNNYINNCNQLVNILMLNNQKSKKSSSNVDQNEPTKMDQDKEDENHSVSSNDTGKFLREYWNELGTFFEGIDKIPERKGGPCEEKDVNKSKEDTETKVMKPGESRVVNISEHLEESNAQVIVDKSDDNKIEDKIAKDQREKVMKLDENSDNKSKNLSKEEPGTSQ